MWVGLGLGRRQRGRTMGLGSGPFRLGSCVLLAREWRRGWEVMRKWGEEVAVLRHPLLALEGLGSDLD